MNTPLLTDLYQLTMGYSYWKQDMAETEAVFHLFYRRAPFGGNATIVAGTTPAIDFLTDLRFTDTELIYLANLTGADGTYLFEQGFLDYLRDIDWTLTVHAIPEGELAFANEPLMRIQGPLIQCQLVETALLNIVNFQTLVATKAARIKEAAGTDPVVEFGLRRAQGPDGGLSATRAAYIGGCGATSNVLAGQIYGIPVKGTHAHSWVMSFPTELEAFHAYADAMPNNAILLVDTYDTVEGVKNAITTGRGLQEKGHRLLGIRLDSGDLVQLSQEARRLLDQAGMEDAQVVASNDLDEYEIARLKAAGARIDVWGIGTRLVTAYDQPALGGVYKLGAIRLADGTWDYKVKLSNDAIKVSNPGIIQISRLRTADGTILQDTLFNEVDGPTETHPGALTHHVLEKMLDAGKRSYQPVPIAQVREQALANWKNRPQTPIILLDPSVADTKRALLIKNGLKAS